MEFLNISAKQYRDMMKGKNNKYHAVKTESDGIIFDSKFEAEKWTELNMLARIGVIKNLQRQVKFVLQEGYVNNKGKKIRPILYFGDFFYEKDGKKYVVDTKGVKTPVYKIKKKMFEAKFKDYIFIELTKKNPPRIKKKEF